MKLVPKFSSLFVIATLALTGCAAYDEGTPIEPTNPSVDGTDPLASVHVKGGKSAKPGFTDNGLSLSSSAALSGLGNGDVLITLTAVGQPISTCTNPSGATQPPGQNPAEVTLSGTQSIPAKEIKNGTLSFNVQTGAPASPVAGAPGCPNKQWTQDITDVSFSSATITVQQNGATVLTLTCTISPSSSNGAVPAGSITCTSS